jgi:hypothetical protein
MVKRSYEEQSGYLIGAIDIAIEAVQNIHPKGFNQKHVDIFLESYFGWKKRIMESEPKFRNLTSLKYDIVNVFTYFNEASGPTVDLFWNMIKEQNLPYERVNKLAKILSKQKIKNRIEYDYVIDAMVPFKQQGMISEDDFQLLNKLLGDFEKS